MNGTNQHSQPVSKPFGALTITASRPVDGGFAINVFTGPIREDALHFTTADRDLYRRVYAVIRQGGREGVRPAGILQAVTEALTDDLRVAERRRDRTRIELLNDALDRLATPAQAAADKVALANIAETIRTGRQARPAHALSAWGQQKADHAKALADARTNRPVLFGTEVAA